MQDGWLILNTIVTLFRDYHPLTFFGVLGLIVIVAGLVPGGLVIAEYLKTGLVPRLPSAVLAVGLILIGVLTMFVGLILHTVVRRFQESDRQLQSIAEDLSGDRARAQTPRPAAG